MSLRFAGLVAVLSMLAGPADAGIFGKGTPKFPKPISMTSDRVQRSHTVGKSTRLSKYSGATWGSRFDLARDNYPTKPLMPFLLHTDR